MAKDHSFDIVSTVDMQEVDNAVHQASKELVQRYDLKDTGSTIALDKAGSSITVEAPDDFILRQVVDVLGTKLVRREVDLKAVRWEKTDTIGGGRMRKVGMVVNGIEADIARDINKKIRDQKLKVKVQIEGDKVRVFAGKIDDLQEVIAFMKSQDFGIPLQFINYR